MNRMMVLKGGSPALHMLGDISRQDDNFIRVNREYDGCFYGCFEEGYGFIDVRFRKEDCRTLTKEEIEEQNKKYFAINGQARYKIHIDENGDFVSRERSDV